MRLQGKRLLAKCWPATGSAGARRIILLYHSVGGGPWAVSTEVFRAQMAWLAEHYRIVDLDGLLAAAGEASPHAAITFDDGYASLRDAALPVLSDLGAGATVYLNSGWIGEERVASQPAQGHYPDEAFLSWADVEQLQAAGWTMASHGVDHLDLTACSEPETIRQLRVSKEDIERRTGFPCRHFAYAWGRSSLGLRRAVAEAGYRYAVGARHAPLREDSDPYLLPRINIANDYTLDDFKAIARGDWDYLGWIQQFRERLG